MSDNMLFIASYALHEDANGTVRNLWLNDIDMRNVSVVGRDYRYKEHVIGYYGIGDRARYWGRLGPFWNSLWKLLQVSAFFFVPEIGPVVAGGPIVTWMLDALSKDVRIDGLSVVGEALCDKGLARESAEILEDYLKSNRFLVIVRDTAEKTGIIERIAAKESHFVCEAV